MQFQITTFVKQQPSKVFAGFTQELFLRLAPPFPRIKLKRFDGCAVGDVVSVELNFIFFRNQWESLITAQAITEKEIYFIDEGKKLPFFLRAWQHTHRIVQQGTGSIIIDAIVYKSPFWLLDYVLYPMMYLQFAYRKPIYKRVFR